MSMILGNIFTLEDTFRGIELFTGSDKVMAFYRPARVGSDAHSGRMDKRGKAIAERVAGNV